MAIRSQYKTPNATSGGYDVQHFETEVKQLSDASALAKTLLSKTTTGDMQTTLGISAFAKTMLDDADRNTLLATIMPDGAGPHNAIYRGKDLTAAFNNGTMSTNIKNGTFKDIFVGDYITKDVTIDGKKYSGVKFVVGDCDYYYNMGDDGHETTAHHVLMVPDTILGSAPMNKPFSETTT